MMIFELKFLIWLILIIVLTLSGSGPTDVSRSEHVAPSRATEVGRRPATFTESYRWIDGVAVEVVEIRHTTLLPSTTVDAPNAQVGDSCSEFTIVVRNGSDHQVRVALPTRLRFGPGLTTASAYVATPGHAEHVTVQYIRPGDVSYPYTVGFVLPGSARDDVQLEVGIDNWRHERAVFAGTITTR
jgi:hypothetical protein